MFLVTNSVKIVCANVCKLRVRFKVLESIVFQPCARSLAKSHYARFVFLFRITVAAFACFGVWIELGGVEVGDGREGVGRA